MATTVATTLFDANFDANTVDSNNTDANDDYAKVAAICNSTGHSWMISMLTEYDLGVLTEHSGFVASFKRLQTCPIAVRRPNNGFASDKWFSRGVRNVQTMGIPSVRIVWGIVATGNVNVLATLVKHLAREHTRQLQRDLGPEAPAGGIPLVTYDNPDSETYPRWLAVGFQPTGGTNENGESQLIYTRHLADDEAVGQDLRAMNDATRAAAHTRVLHAAATDATNAQWSYQIETIPLRSGITLRVNTVSIDGILPAPDARTRALVQALRRSFPNNYVVLRTTMAYLKEHEREWAGSEFFVMPAGGGANGANGTGGTVRMLCLG